MKLIKIKLTNFKGVKEEDIDFDGKNADIYGANGTGKTSVFDAFTWLLFGKSSEGNPGFSPKTVTSEGYAHNLEHSVECSIEIDGTVNTFKRSFCEVYKKIRGSAEAVFSGHRTEYWINGVPQKEKEYQRFWHDIFPNDDTVKMLTIPNYFAEQLSWDNRRTILMEMCGNITDDDVISSDPELRELAELAGKLSISDYKKTVKATRSEINKKLDVIPARIDEAKKAVPEISRSETELKAKKAECEQIIMGLEKKKTALITGCGAAETAAAETLRLKNQLEELRTSHAKKMQKISDANYIKISDIQNKLRSQEDSLYQCKKALDISRRKVDDIERRRSEIMQSHKALQLEYAQRQSEKFDEALTVCDKCGQSLPPEKITAVKDEFNERKSKKLSELLNKMGVLIEQGKSEASKEMLSDAKKQLEFSEQNVKSCMIAADILYKKLDKERANAENEKMPPFEDTPEYSQLTEMIRKSEEKEHSAMPDTSKTDAQIAAVRAELRELDTELTKLDVIEAQKLRIQVLEDTERDLCREYEKAEKALYLCDKFTRIKAAMLTDKINSKFKTVRFQLFRENVTNDGTEDICSVLVPSANGALVPFSDANKAARVNAGIELIEALGKYYGVQMPVFIDNAESISQIIPTQQQLIRLIVSENDTKLRIETV